VLCSSPASRIEEQVRFGGRKSSSRRSSDYVVSSVQFEVDSIVNRGRVSDTIMESITANEVAGLGVGALLLAAALAAPKVDAFIARGQRR
jgi:hypothetical protein